VKSRLGELTTQREQRKAKRIEIDKFMAALRQQERFIDEFDEELFSVSMERMLALNDGGVRVVFRDGRTKTK